MKLGVSQSSVQGDTGQNYYMSRARCRTSRTPCQRDRLRALVLATLVSVGPDVEQGSAEIIEVARLRGVGVGGAGAWRWWRGHGGGGGGAVGRSSRCCSCSSSTRWLTFSCSSSSSSPGCARAVHRQSAGHFSCAQRGTHSAYCAEDCFWRRRPCDQQ